MNPVSSSDDGSESTSRRQGHHREVGSEGSRSAKLWPTCLRAMHRQADEMSYKAEHPGVSQSLKLSEYAKKKISIHMSSGWVVVEGVFLRLGHR
jgi:hypothetical protein